VDKVLRRAIGLAAVAGTCLALGLRCAHETIPCPTTREVPRRWPEPPSDPTTARAVEQTGFRYDRCAHGPRYRLSRAGTRALSLDELRAVKDHLLPPTSGPSSTAIGICGCETGAKSAAESGGEVAPLCLSIFLRAGDLDPPALAALVAERLRSLSLDDAAVGVRVDLHAKPGPRCSPDDPACGPIPVSRDKCPADVGYRPGASRTPVFRQPDGGGECAHDGECDSGTCESCFSTREIDRSISGDCFYSSGMKANALCGCVSGRCTFFVPGP
jgi:hypothetical protein